MRSFSVRGSGTDGAPTDANANETKSINVTSPILIDHLSSSRRSNSNRQQKKKEIEKRNEAFATCSRSTTFERDLLGARRSNYRPVSSFIFLVRIAFFISLASWVRRPSSIACSSRDNDVTIFGCCFFFVWTWTATFEMAAAVEAVPVAAADVRPGLPGHRLQAAAPQEHAPVAVARTHR